MLSGNTSPLRYLSSGGTLIWNRGSVLVALSSNLKIHTPIFKPQEFSMKVTANTSQFQFLRSERAVPY